MCNSVDRSMQDWSKLTLTEVDLENSKKILEAEDARVLAEFEEISDKMDACTLPHDLTLDPEGDGCPGCGWGAK